MDAHAHARARLPLQLLLLAVAVAAFAATASAQLSPQFYSSSCPNVEKIVFSVIERKFKEDPGTSALLLRLMFHDCFANGCDASILIDPLSNQSAEKEAGPNVSVKGYDIIDEIKTELEKACPGVVSCADIIALGTRDGVRLAGGPSYDVPTGRRDSLVSNREDGDGLPGPDIAVPKLMAEFSQRGFTVEDMIVLLAGGHTIGKCKCFFIEVDAAPIDPAYRSNVTTFCDGKEGEKAAVPLDPITPDVVDPNYFGLVMAKKMPLTVDRLLGMDPRTAPIVKAMAAKPADFMAAFGKAMEKLSAMKVLTGKEGEIRKSCSEFNNPVASDDGPSVIRISSLGNAELMGWPPATGIATAEPAPKKKKARGGEEKKEASGGAMEARKAAGEKASRKPRGAEGEANESAGNAFVGAGDVKIESNEATPAATAAAAGAGGKEAEEAEKLEALKAARKKKKADAAAVLKAKGLGSQSFSMAGAGEKGIGAADAARKAKGIASQSFSMAGAGDKAIGGEKSSKMKAVGSQSFSMAGAGDVAAAKAKAIKSQSFSMAGSGQEPNKGAGAGGEEIKKAKKGKKKKKETEEEAKEGEAAAGGKVESEEEGKKRPQPKLRGGLQQ
uniref:peroxidase n=1 Tax=Leersia perrieri TaxID=77586 RepID=A0A0D9VPN7_9ORYZ